MLWFQCWKYSRPCFLLEKNMKDYIHNNVTKMKNNSYLTRKHSLTPFLMTPRGKHTRVFEMLVYLRKLQVFEKP